MDQDSREDLEGNISGRELRENFVLKTLVYHIFCSYRND